jgi:hypothetical protein
VIHAVSPGNLGPGVDASHFDDVAINSSRINNALRIAFHRSDASLPTVLRRWTVSGYTDAAVRVAEFSGDAGESNRGYFDFVCWTLPGNAELEAGNFSIGVMDPASVYRVQRRNGTAYQLNPNGTTTTIAQFATCN